MKWGLVEMANETSAAETKNGGFPYNRDQVAVEPLDRGHHTERNLNRSALHVVNSLQDLTHLLQQNKHSNVLVLPSTQPPCSTRLGERHDPIFASQRYIQRIQRHMHQQHHFQIGQYYPVQPTPSRYCSFLADALRGNTALAFLTLEDVPVVDASTNSTFPMFYPQPQLFWLGQAIFCHPNLQGLSLTNCNLGERGCIALMQALIHHSCNIGALSSQVKLQSLSLEGNRIGDQGAYWIAQAFESENCGLLQLDLSRNNLSGKGAEYLAVLLAWPNSKLNYLLLNGNSVGPQGAVMLARALESNKSLGVLGLSSNGIQDEGAVALTEAAHRHPGLHCLILDDNNLGPIGCHALATEHRDNPRLNMLELSRNVVELKMLPSITSSMASIQYLCLDECNLQDPHAMLLAEALRHNNVLIDLFLDCNCIGENGATALAWALETNTSLVGLFLEQNPVGEMGAQALCRVLRSCNKSMKRLVIGSPDKNEYRKIQSEIEVYLDMNASGRLRILQSELPTSLWSHFLEQKDIVWNADMLYLFHKEHPNIFGRS